MRSALTLKPLFIASSAINLPALPVAPATATVFLFSDILSSF
jgi:hypothetical protein